MPTDSKLEPVQHWLWGSEGIFAGGLSLGKQPLPLTNGVTWPQYSCESQSPPAERGQQSVVGGLNGPRV